MRRGLNFDTLFPIQDAPSARLMLVKARCLLAAEVISEPDALEVARRAIAFRRRCNGGIDTNSHTQWRGSRRVGSSSLAIGAFGCPIARAGWRPADQPALPALSLIIGV
jgi:hypothetical protein